MPFSALNPDGFSMVRCTQTSRLLPGIVFDTRFKSRGNPSRVHLECEKKNRRSNIRATLSKGLEEGIKNFMIEVDYPLSSYDTAWVAMVASPGNYQIPCFPQCVDWILENQNPDGSWGFSQSHSSLIKDGLSSTLACLIVLKQWSVGKKQVKKGLDFIESYFSSSLNAQLPSSIGFSVIFPGMLERAFDLGLVFPANQIDIDALFFKKKLEIERISALKTEGSRAFLAYVAEGMGKSLNWVDVMRYQRRNGSLFNSPSTTAAALLNLNDTKALEYLKLLLQKFGNSVPAAYPYYMQFQLPLVDKLESLGISRYFQIQIRWVLEEAYRCWMRNEEEVTSNIVTYAMAFRLLRMNGYDISSDALSHVDEEGKFYDLVEGQIGGSSAVLELYKASQIKVLHDEPVLDKINSWTRSYLKKEISQKRINGPNDISEEIEYALKFPIYANLDRLEHKRNIQCCSSERVYNYKTMFTVDNKHTLEFAVEDFNFCQSILRKELKILERWVIENKLDQLKFARQKQVYCYFSAAATLFHPELSDARMSWAKNGVLTTVVDDFFDIGASAEEMNNLITLVEKFDDIHESEFCSKQVEIVFSAVRRTIVELGTKAFVLQGRNVTSHLVEIWLSLMKSMAKEAEWARQKTVPTIEEYMENAFTSFALGPIILPALYFVGPKLSDEVIRHPEYTNLFREVSTCGRLLNDIQTFKREGKEGVPNMLSLLIQRGSGLVSEEAAKAEMMDATKSSRRKLLKLVLHEGNGSVMPRPCKDLFWKMCRIVHAFYSRTDGFSSPKEMFGAVNAILNEPLTIEPLKQARDDVLR